MVGLVIAGIAGAIVVLWAADHLGKVWVRARRRRMMRDRLATATVRADRQQERRQASVQASKELTSVMPAIQRPPLTAPGPAPHRAARPRNRSENTGPQATHPGRRSSRTGERPSRAADQGRRR